MVKYLTEQGLEKLKKELEQLDKVERKKISEKNVFKYFLKKFVIYFSN